MRMLPSKWSISRLNMVPIVEGLGEAYYKECEVLLLRDAVDIINEASKFKGVPGNTNNDIQSNTPIAVFFTLIFPSNDECDEFMEEVKKGNILKRK